MKSKKKRKYCFVLTFYNEGIESNHDVIFTNLNQALEEKEKQKNLNDFVNIEPHKLILKSKNEVFFKSKIYKLT